MKPKTLDTLLLAYLITLAVAPTTRLLGIWTDASDQILNLFPFGIFALALGMIILRAIFPRLRFDFGLTGGRWASIIALLLAMGHTSFALAFLVRPGAFALPVEPLGIGQFLTLLPMIFTVGFGIYAVCYLFAGGTLGPGRKAKHP